MPKGLKLLALIWFGSSAARIAIAIGSGQKASTIDYPRVILMGPLNFMQWLHLGSSPGQPAK